MSEYFDKRWLIFLIASVWAWKQKSVAYKQKCLVIFYAIRPVYESILYLVRIKQYGIAIYSWNLIWYFEINLDLKFTALNALLHKRKFIIKSCIRFSIDATQKELINSQANHLLSLTLIDSCIHLIVKRKSIFIKSIRPQKSQIITFEFLDLHVLAFSVE